MENDRPISIRFEKASGETGQQPRGNQRVIATISVSLIMKMEEAAKYMNIELTAQDLKKIIDERI